MTKKALEVGRDSAAAYISRTWDSYNTQRQTKLDEWKELRNYVFATDTKTTSNKTLPWKNSTTLPKLCQIRDNLHSNYISALFPNDEWLQWEGYSKDDSTFKKKNAIEAYMGNKTRESHFRTEASKLVYDYIDYGNAFVTGYFENSYRLDEDGNKIIDYIGPKAQRISPLDIVFNPLASSFKESFKIIRSLRTVGELNAMAESEPDNLYLKEAIKKRDYLLKNMNSFGVDDFDREEAYQVDGFGNYFEYLQSGYVEILEFYGDIHNTETQEYKSGRIVTVIDRAWVIRDDPYPTWLGYAPIFHTGWRTRPDNLWAMGPLDNLVGLQYRVDHLENLKADAMDLAVLPPLVIAGEVEDFTYGPNSEIHIDENGTVTELARNAQWVIQANNEIAGLLSLMEQFAGAPSEAMGIRTPGEKTMYEVQQLQNAAGRIFQEKITNFEIELLEPVLNSMLETARRNLDQNDVARVMNDDLGVTDFLSITKDDITASGKLRPIGARHFAVQAQLLQNLTGLFNSNLYQTIAPHISSKKLSRLVEDVMGLSRFQLFSPNIAVFEQQETARLVNQAQEDLQMEQQVGVDGQMI
jgi:uncharacterized protein YqgQ